MIINSIHLKNYRCFNDAKFEFTKNGKLDLVVGVIGTGKTELLFSLWWTLYDFDFKHLKNKESTPYAINSDLYNELQFSEEFSGNSCFVELNVDIENEDNSTTNYVIRKTSKFYKQYNKILHSDEFQIVKYKQNGEKELPITDPIKYIEIISKIIPKKVLYGVLFDGERMRNLSSVNKDSIAAIEGVISDITNKELLQKTLQYISNEKQSFIKARTRLSKKIGGSTSEIAQEIQDKTNDKILKELIVKNREKEIMKNEDVVKEIESKFQFIKETRNLIDDKKRLEVELKNIKLRITETFDDLSNKLRYAFLLPMNPIFEKVNQIIENYNVPRGLNVQAVESILENETCICGTHINEEIHKKLSNLMSELPPDNLNTMIGETRKQSITKREYYLKEYNSLYDKLSRLDSEKVNIQEEIDRKIDEIGNIDDAEIQKLENRYREALQLLGKLKEQLDKDVKELSSISVNVSELEMQFKMFSANDVEITNITRYVDLLSKYERLTISIIEHNKITALNKINELLDLSFSMLSEDYDLGRRLYITQYIEPKYSIIAYKVEDLEKFKSKIDSTALQKELGDFDIEDQDQLLEAYIIKSKTSSSTGQAKINTLSFVYAIMSFVNLDKENVEELTQNRKRYPLLIDAPLSEISGKSLEMISTNLPKFNKQTIVMIDDNTFRENRVFFEKSIGKHYSLKKNTNSSYTSVEEIK